MKKISIKILLLVALPTLLFSQRKTEEEVKNEFNFVAATGLKLTGKYDKAAEIFEKLLLDQPKNDAAWYELARTYEALKEDSKSLDAIRKAVALNPENEWFQVFEGDLLQRLGRTKEAAKIFESLTKRFPENDVFYEKWAFLLLLDGDANGALKAYDRLEKRLGTTAEVALKKHRIYDELKNSKKATEELEKLVRKFPEENDYRHLLAEYLQKTGETARAKFVFQQILAKNPDDAVAKLALVESGGGSDLARIEALKPLFKDGNQPIDLKIKELLNYLPAVDEGKNDLLIRAVLDLATTLETAHADDPKAFSISGDLFFHANRLPEAATRYQKCIALRGNVFSVWENLMTIQNDLRDWPALLKTSESALDFFPNQAKVMLFQGIAQRETGRSDEAVESLNQAILMAGNNLLLKSEAFDGLGLVFFQKKDWAMARSKMEEGVKKCGEANPFLLEHLGDAIFQLGDADAAVGFWEKARAKGLKSAKLDAKIQSKRFVE